MKNFIILAGAASLSACATVDANRLNPIDQEILDANDLFYSIQCELKSTVDKVAQSDPAIARQWVDATLKLTVVETRGTGGGVTLTIPVGATSLKVGPNSTPSQKSTRTMSFGLVFDTSRLPECDENDQEIKNAKLIGAGLGLGSWIQQSVSMVKDKDFGEPKSASYSVEFTVTNSLSSNASSTRKISDERSYVFDVKPSRSRVVTHNLSLTTTKQSKTANQNPTGPTARNEKDFLSGEAALFRSILAEE